MGIHPNTLRRWEREGKIRVVRTPKGRRRIPESEVKRLLGIKEEEGKGIKGDVKKRVAIYARVSSYDQKNDLERQKEELIVNAVEKGYEIKDIITEISSGLNENRRGLRKLFKLVENREIDKVLVTYKDRLTRFGFRYLKEFFKSYNVEIEVLYDKEDKSAKDELVEDLIAIITSFVGKLYGMRSKKKKEIVKRVKNILRCRDEVNTEL